MPFQKGNKLGRARHSAAREMADAYDLWNRWTKPGLGEEILKRMGSGNESLEDVFFALGHKENSKVLIEIFKKLYPDKKEIKADFDLTWEE